MKLLLFASACIFAAGGTLTIKTYLDFRNATPIEAVVVRTQLSGRGGAGKRVYLPTFVYTDPATEESVEWTPKLGSTRYQFREDEKVELLFSASGKCLGVDDPISNYLFPVALTIFGFFALMFSATIKAAKDIEARQSENTKSD